jgi:type II secretory pathway component PulJ
MKSRRRGYALIEILGMIAAMVLLMALSAEPARVALAEIPQMDRHYQAWIRMTDMLETLRRDVETASAIRLSEPADPNSYSLSLETPAGTVDYRLGSGLVIRQQAGPSTDATEWTLPAGRVKLNTWSGEAGTYAVEVATWVEQQAGGRTRKHYEQTHVFFRRGDE